MDDEQALREAVEAALLSRRSVRAFLATPIPRELVERLLTLAARAPSNSNTQPWRVHVLTGEAKRVLGEAIVQDLELNGRVAEPEYAYQRKEWCEPFHSRRRQFGRSLYEETLGLDAADLQRRHAHHIRNYSFFGAPVGLIVTVSRHCMLGALVDAGLFMEGLAIAARAHGFHTCLQASFIDFHPIIREQLQIPDDHMIVCGVSLGYADPGHCLERLRTPREPVSGFATFHDGEHPALQQPPGADDSI